MLGWTFLFSTFPQIKEFTYDYTECKKIGTNMTCAEFFENTNNTGQICNCRITPTLEKFDVWLWSQFILLKFELRFMQCTLK